MHHAGSLGRLRLVQLALALSLVALAPHANALPVTGSDAPNARVADPDGHVADLAALRGRPVLVFYESRDSLPQNRALVAELAALRARGKEPYGSRLALVPVADVTSYDYWPVRGFVKATLRRHARAAGVDIFCDFSGEFGQTLGVARGESNVVLLGPDGAVRFAAHGALTAEQRAALLDILGVF